MEYMETMYARRNMVVREDFLVLNEHKNANRKSSSSDEMGLRKPVFMLVASKFI